MATRILGRLDFLAFVLALLFLDNTAIVAADCSNTPVGLENMYIMPNTSFTASSFFNNKYAPSNARLNGYNGWGPGRTQYTNAYLQVDLGYPYVICAIATQGSSVYNEWVKEYRIMASVHGTKWIDYKENDQVKLFTGNTDRNTIVKNTLNKPLVRYVRFFPTSYHNWLTMRVGLFGYAEACDNVPLGMESKIIQDITASSGQSTAKNARLHYTSGSSWCASTSDSNPYLQIDLGTSHLICAVATQGNSMVDQWVKTYQIDTSTNGTTWTTYQENNTDRVFQGNFDRSTVVRHVLYHGTVARYIRFIPKTYQDKRCLRTEIYGYQVNQTCSSLSLGIPSSHLVPNRRFTATSYYNKIHQPHMARLGSNTTWGPRLQNSYDYLQIDLGAVSYICSIATQGNGVSNLYEWVTEYRILHSTSNNQWITYRENGTDKDFSGNTDQTTIVTNSIKNLFKAKFIRILPTKLNRWKSIRVDFRGLPAACLSSLGLENSQIPDSQITSTTSLDNSHTPPHSRLYGSSSWCSSSSPSNNYIQVDLGETKTVTGIATQGDKDLNKWVTSYKVSYSFDKKTWNEFKEGPLAKVFNGNKNSTPVIVNWLSHPIAARYVRIWPQTNSGGTCLRFDLYGCTYYIPESRSNQVTADERSALLQWTNIQTLEGTAENFMILVSDRTGLRQNLTAPKLTTSKQITNLRPFTKYEVKLIAVKTRGQPLWQSTSKFQTLVAEPEGIPTIERLTAASSQSINVTIKFTEPDKLNGPLHGYRIYYTPEGGDKEQSDVGIVTTATLTNLKKFTVYTISVSVRNSKYVGPVSGTKQEKTLEDVPEIGPQIKQAKEVNATTYLVAWQPLTLQQSNGIIAKYEIIGYLETTIQSKTLSQKFLTASTKGSQLYIRNLRPNQKYTVLVRGYTGAGPGPNSTVSFLTSTSKIKSSTSSICTTQGNAITLGCLASNEQAGSVRYTWTKDGEEVDDDSTVKIEENKLIVESVSKDHFGTYECNATNIEGTVIFTTSKYEVQKCSGESNVNQKDIKQTNVIFYIIPLVLIIVVMVICIAFLACRLRRSRQNDKGPSRMGDAMDNPALESDALQQPSSESSTAPQRLTQDDGHKTEDNTKIAPKQGVTAVYESLDDASKAAEEEGKKLTGNYMELKRTEQQVATYESLDDAARAAEKEGKKLTGDYMELKPMGQASTYESLHHGDESQAPERYENSPGYGNMAIDNSEA